MSSDSSPNTNVEGNDLQACKQLFGDIGIPVRLGKKNRFFRIKDTLSRIGNAEPNRKLSQLVYILHRQGCYALMHYKELQALDAARAGVTDDTTAMDPKDYAKRNTIATMLHSWGMIEILDPAICEAKAPMSTIKVLTQKEAPFWVCKSTYSIGKYKVRRFQRNKAKAA